MENIEILLLDDCFVYDSGDPFLRRLSLLGKWRFWTKLDPCERRRALENTQVLFTNQAHVTGELIGRMPSLRYVGVMATGFNHIDLEAAARRGICVCNVPAYSSESVAQGVFAHILNIYNRVSDMSRQVRSGRWLDFGQAAYWANPVLELNGKVLGIVGLGNIGTTVARIASRGFSMRVVVYTSRKPEDLPYGVESLPLDEVFAQSDILSLHCPLTDRTRNLVNVRTLSLMKSSAVLVNTGRGGLVDEEALYRALVSGKLAAAGLDVLDPEPPRIENPLLGLENCFFTPHVCFATREARLRLLAVCLSNLRAFLAGKPVNEVAGLRTGK